MKIVRVLAVPTLVALAACSSSGSEQDKGVEGEGVGAAASAPDVNPDGVPYPTDNIGTLPRSGARKGNRLENFKFLGYPNADMSQGLQPISMAQFFDPEGKKYKIIRLVASASWCPPCQGEAELVAGMKSDLEQKKVLWLTSLSEGPTSGPSTKKDLDNWIKEFKGWNTHWLDPSNKNLGPFYDRAAIPWNATVNAQTMEILESKTGAPGGKEDLLKELDDLIAKSGGAKY